MKVACLVRKSQSLSLRVGVDLKIMKKRNHSQTQMLKNLKN